MVGHGFNSEISQNKALANNLSNDNYKSSNNSSSQLTSSENLIGKKIKVIHTDFFLLKENSFFFFLLDINIRRKRTNDA